MKIHYLLPLIALCGFALNAQEVNSAPTNGFETPGPVDAKAFLPESQMSGALHSVGPEASNDGLLNTYQLNAGGGTREVLTTPLLKVRIREIYALDYLRNLSKTEEFGKALGKALGAKADSVVGAVRDPVGTMKSLPKGASKFFGGIGEAIKGGKSETESSTVDRIAGTDKAKASLALKLGVSPYTDNQELQEELTNTARAMAGGGLVLNVATMAATGGVGAALSVIGVNQTMQEALVNSSPSDLRIMNRKKLFALGLSREEADAFLMHSQYTPWNKTSITDSLSRIGANPGEFLKQARKATSQEDAFYFQRLAQLLLQYHGAVAPLRSIRLENGLICGIDRDGNLVIPVSQDYAIWSARIAARTDEFVDLSRSRGHKGISLWTDGQLSVRLCDEFKARGITWKMNALESNKQCITRARSHHRHPV